MDKYESPTIEQAGGPNNHNEPMVVWPILNAVVFSEAVGVTMFVVGAFEVAVTTHTYCWHN